MSSLVNKVKEALHSDKPSQPEGTHGPHESRIANAADPRVDSDRDHRAAHTLGGSGTGEYATGFNPNAESRAFGGTDGPATKTDGPHKSNLLNKADPRVDSDRDYSRNAGFNPSRTDGTGAYNINETARTSGYTENMPGREFGTTSGLTSGHTTGHTAGFNSGLSSGIPEGTAGPHGSRLANAADPRVDSDLDGSQRLGSHNQHAHGAVGSGFGTTTAARHEGEGFGTGAAFTTGPAPNTAGPHKSDMLNKMDPRVDSDLDGSKTLGGDKTFSRPNESSAYAHKDPRDAAQVPPSVMQKHIGPPTIAHDDHTHDRARRHPSISHQEQHRGL